MIVTHFQLLSGNFWKNDFIVFLFKYKFNISLYSFNISIYSLLVYSQRLFYVIFIAKHQKYIIQISTMIFRFILFS